ncbi:hypothetical protein EXN66_Car001589 [Channa argus]|uniref:Uncharacterized protein n=1 Tax=Channa argus TaxID=215402 RepID=A0A6G1R0W9_CHAAH|nr:hypothetical protein EXN66_Car001589 [Channa argus]
MFTSMTAGTFGGVAQHWGFQSRKRSSSNTRLLTQRILFKLFIYRTEVRV